MKLSTKTVFNLLIFSESICSLNLLKAQKSNFNFELEDNFKLVYESLDSTNKQKEVYHFIGDYVLRETFGKGVVQLFGGPPSQIINLKYRKIYNLLPPDYAPKEIDIEEKSPVEFSEVLSVSDTIIDGFEIAYIKMIRGEFPKYQGETLRYYFKNFGLPPSFLDLHPIYRDKNTFFNSINENLLYKIVSRNEGGVIHFEMQLIEVSRSKYSAEDIEKMLNIN